MSPSGTFHVMAVTLSTENDSDANNVPRQLSSGMIQIDHQTHKLIRDEDGSLRQDFPVSIALSSKSRIEIRYKKKSKLWKSTVTRTLDVRALLASAKGAHPQDLSVVESGIRVKFSCKAADIVPAPAPEVPQNEAGSSASQSTDTLVPTTQTMLRDDSRFRILVIGKTGVGKSSLIHTAFGIDQAHVSDFQRGRADINEGLVSPVNERFVLHDSVGIEPGDKDNYETLKNFIQSRQSGPLADRLHAIWFCIQTPFAGGRLLEAGAEDFFQSKPRILGSIPLIVVYTKFDLAVDALLLKSPPNGLDDETMIKNTRSEVESAARQWQDEITRHTGDSKPLPYAVISTEENYQHTLQHLITVTYQEVGISSMPEAQATSVLTQMAQRIDPRLKIRGSIDVGRERYWKALGTGPHFVGHTIWDCLCVIHHDMVAVWNFNDLSRHLNDKQFRELVVGLVQEMEMHPVNPNKALVFAGSSLVTVVSACVAAAANPAAPIVIPVIASLVTAVWLYQVYQNVKNVQRIFIAYIVHLTHIMETLFILCAHHHTRLTRRAVKQAYCIYHGSDLMKQVHAHIQTYRDTPGRDAALQMIESLVKYEWDDGSDVQIYYAEVGKLNLAQLKMDQDEAWTV